VGEPGRYGKEIEGDLWEGKRTLILIRLLQEVSRDERERVRRILSVPRRSRERADMHWMRERMHAHGCVEHARRSAHALAGPALHEFGLLCAGLPDTRDRHFIGALATWVLERT